MRALTLLLIGLALIVPAQFLLLQPQGPWLVLWHTLGLTVGIIGTLVILVGFAMAVWRLIRGR